MDFVHSEEFFNLHFLGMLRFASKVSPYFFSILFHLTTFFFHNEEENN